MTKPVVKYFCSKCQKDYLDIYEARICCKIPKMVKNCSEKQQNLMKMLAEQIRSKRISKGLNQAELAKLVNLSRVSISTIETSDVSMSVITLFNIAKLLEIDLNKIIETWDITQSNPKISRSPKDSNTDKLALLNG